MPAGSKTAEVFAEKTGISEEQADQYAQSLPAYWGPQGGTSGAVYFGASICLLFIFGLIFYRGWHRYWIIAATMLGIALAWGRHFESLNYFLFDHLPFYNKFRAPSMAMVIPQLTFPLMAVFGLNEIFGNRIDKNEFRKKFRLATIVSVIFIAVLALLYFTLDYRGESDSVYRTRLTSGMIQQMSQQGQPTPEMQQQADEFGRSVTNALKEDRRALFSSDLVRSILYMGLTLGLLYLFLKEKLNKNVVSIALTAIVFIDLIGIDLRYLNNEKYVDKDEFEMSFTPTAADLQVLKDTSYYRVFNTDADPFLLSGSTSRTSYLHNSIGGYHPAKLALYDDLKREHLEKGNIRVFNMLNAKYFIVTDPQSKQPVVQQNPGALGPAWFVDAIRYINNANEEIRALDDFNPQDTAIVDKREQGKILFPPQSDTTATIQLLENANDRIVYKSSSKSNGFAVFSEIYYPNGWKAFIDGKETPIARTNYVLRGLSITAGDHTIEFRFEPASYVIGDRISLVVGIISILILLYAMFVLWKNYHNEQKRPIPK